MSYGRPPPDVEGMTSLKVDNLTYRTSPDTLRRVFEKYGRVGDVYIPRDRYTKESRGFAFVRFHDKRDAEDAMDAMDGAVLDAAPGVGAAPGPAVAPATAAPSLAPALARGRGPRPSPGRREGPSPSPRRCPGLARAPGPAPGPGVRRPCPRGSPSPGRAPRAPPSLPRRKERCPLKRMLRSPV
uniref:RRM domain-containing protein n=1 Tax=Neovison vison TaxID=452646 RepID=A0A8C7B8A5_NEOVI